MVRTRIYPRGCPLTTTYQLGMKKSDTLKNECPLVLPINAGTEWSRELVSTAFLLIATVRLEIVGKSEKGLQSNPS
jgi:hypothetical protein